MYFEQSSRLQSIFSLLRSRFFGMSRVTSQKTAAEETRVFSDIAQSLYVILY